MVPYAQDTTIFVKIQEKSVRKHELFKGFSRLQHKFPQICRCLGRKKRERNIQYGESAAFSLFEMKPVHGPGKGCQYAGCELRVAVQLQGEFHHVTGGIICLPVAEYKTAMRNATVVSLKFFLRNKMHCGFVADEVVWHGLDSRFNSLQIGAFFRYHKAFPQVHLITGGIRSLTAADGFQIFFLGNGILLAIFYAGDAADGIGVTLAYALAPEGVAQKV